MSERYTAVLAEALKLADKERAALVDELLGSLGEPPSEYREMTEAEFKAELDRRHEEFLRDPSVGVPWEEVKRLTRID